MSQLSQEAILNRVNNINNPYRNSLPNWGTIPTYEEVPTINSQALAQQNTGLLSTPVGNNVNQDYIQGILKAIKPSEYVQVGTNPHWYGDSRILTNSPLVDSTAVLGNETFKYDPQTGNYIGSNGLSRSFSDLYQNNAKFLTKEGNPFNIQEKSWLGENFGNIASGINAGVGLLNAYNAFQTRGLLEEQLDAQINAMNRNIANQAKIYNNKVDSSYAVASGMKGARDPYGNARPLSVAERDAFKSKAKDKYINGSAIA